MNQDGFTLTELIITIGLSAILITLATFSFKSWGDKDKIDAQFKTMYADLQGVRSEALYKKRERSVRITSTAFSIYSSRIDPAVTAIAPIKRKTLRVPITTSPAGLQLDFDQMGVASICRTGVSPCLDNFSSAICVQAGSAKSVFNSILLQKTRIQLGTFSGSGCSSANIKPQ